MPSVISLSPVYGLTFRMFGLDVLPAKFVSIMTRAPKTLLMNCPLDGESYATSEEVYPRFLPLGIQYLTPVLSNNLSSTNEPSLFGSEMA